MLHLKYTFASLPVVLLFTALIVSAETFEPYRTVAAVPQSVEALWEDYDPRAEALDVTVHKEWQSGGVITRYITFTVGTFKGSPARIAAYYSFPKNGMKNPGFVWCHGGGQRADRARGIYFAKQGFATLDINWLGRPMEADVAINTDWGKVDPTQGPRFYTKALRKHWKRNLLPDAHTIDPVPSPRNNNWFLLVVAAKRAISFLEQQPEVDPNRIGFSGFSMGGTVTSMVAMDPRLKAVAPFVGGAAYLHVDFTGVPGTSLKAHVAANLELYAKTVDPGAYWPRVKCPVLFISSSNDFHSPFDRIYESMALLPHENWRVTTNMHHNHGPGPEQWGFLIRWFNQYLKHLPQKIPATPASELVSRSGQAVFTVKPDNAGEALLETEIYYSYDPDAVRRFWHRAEAQSDAGDASQVAVLDLPEGAPLYVFALCRYALEDEAETMQGKIESLTVNSGLQTIIPEPLDLGAPERLKQSLIVEDFSKGYQDWFLQGSHALKTYKFQSPLLDRSKTHRLCLQIDPGGRDLMLQLSAEGRVPGPTRRLQPFHYTRVVQGSGVQNILIESNAFKNDAGHALSWWNIVRFSMSLVDRSSKKPLDLRTNEARAMLKAIKLVDVSK